MHSAFKIMRDSGMELVVFNAIAGGLSLVAVFLWGFQFLFAAFGFSLLLLSVGLMLIGGALDLSSTGTMRVIARQVKLLLRSKAPELEEDATPEERRRLGAKAATYAVTGVLLFVEAGLLAYAYV